MSSSQQPERVANKRKASEGGDSEAEQPPAAKRPNLEESAAEKLSRSSGRVISITKEPSDDAAQSQERGTLTCNTFSLFLHGPSWTSYRSSLLGH